MISSTKTLKPINIKLHFCGKQNMLLSLVLRANLVQMSSGIRVLQETLNQVFLKKWT